MIGNYPLMGMGFQFGKLKKVLEMDGGYSCTIMGMYLTPLNCALKMVNFIYVLSQ